VRPSLLPDPLLQIKIFEDTMDQLPRDGSDQLMIVLAACKFVDLLIALQMEDFQM
jgi:hypothetical protein